MSLLQQRIHVSGKEQAHVICKECGASKRISVADIKRFGVPIRVKCRCNNTFEVIFDIRRNHRKGTHLFGVCYQSSNDKFGTQIEIIDISSSGIGFKVKSYSRGFKVNDVLDVKFTLDDVRKETISTKIIVKSIMGDRIGAEFYQIDHGFQKWIGFYLL